MLGVNYGPDSNPLAVLARRDRGAISVYARGDDYHDVIKKRLKLLGRWLVARAGGDVKVFVDTAAVMEKPLAAAAGIGWQGKHTNLVSRRFGSWLFLGALFTTLELPADAAEVDHCGTCRHCLDVCPTAAFPAPYRIDARRCISYLTIEHKGRIPRELRPLMGNRIYGCDDCLAVCPWNKFAQAAHEAKLAARERAAPRLDELAQLDDAGFRKLFAHIAGQAHRPRPLCAQCADRHRQQRRAGACGPRRAADGRSRADGARRRRVGGRAAPSPGGICGPRGTAPRCRDRCQRPRGMDGGARGCHIVTMLVCLGFGYSAQHYVAAYGKRFDRIVGTTRTIASALALSARRYGGSSVEVEVFDGESAPPALNDAVAGASALLISIAPRGR